MFVLGTNCLGCIFDDGAVVLARDVPDYALVFGNPARLRGWMCACGIKLVLPANKENNTAQCAVCGMSYHKCDEVVTAIEMTRRS